MSEQSISIDNRHCDWDEMIDACETHGLKPIKKGTGNYCNWVSLQIENIKFSWSIKWSLEKDWQSYWKERDELS